MIVALSLSCRCGPSVTCLDPLRPLDPLDPLSTDPLPTGSAVPAASESELATRFWDRIRVFALRRLRDAAGAEDVAQEVIRRVLEALRANKVRNQAALPGFVFQTAQNVILQHHRGAGREVRALQRMHSGAEASVEADALTLLISEERRRAVRVALDRLDHEDRELLELLYQQQVDPAQLVRQLGVTPGALRVRKHRALQRLADLMSESGEAL